jgi:hypothetical protein
MKRRCPLIPDVSTSAGLTNGGPVRKEAEQGTETRQRRGEKVVIFEEFYLEVS